MAAYARTGGSNLLKNPPGEAPGAKGQRAGYESPVGLVPSRGVSKVLQNSRGFVPEGQSLLKNSWRVWVCWGSVPGVCAGHPAFV
jgi:hypothetical protein